MKHRLFIAVRPPDAFIQKVTILQNQLDHLHLPLVWEPPEKIHLTLTFLGRIEEEHHPAITKILTDVSHRFSPFSLIPSFLDTMYQKHETSYVYLGLSGDTDILKEIYQLLSKSLANIHIPIPQRYLPHITIGKLKKYDQFSTKQYLEKISDFPYQPLPEFNVDNLTLYENLLARDTSHYQQLGRFVLE